MKQNSFSFIQPLRSLTVFLCFLVATSVMAETINPGDYFPLESGMVWTYLDDGLNIATLSVLPGTEMVNGVPTKVLLQSDGEESGSKINYTNDADGIREHKEFSPNVFIDGLGSRDITVVLNPPMKYAGPAETIGNMVNSSGTAYSTVSGLGSFQLNFFFYFHNCSI